jgi:energy-converting hydrogenase Eha subunit A
MTSEWLLISESLISEWLEVMVMAVMVAVILGLPWTKACITLLGFWGILGDHWDFGGFLRIL